jgi:hypothetical protein
MNLPEDLCSVLRTSWFTMMVLHQRDIFLAEQSPSNLGESIVVDLFGVHQIEEEVRGRLMLC